jgi:hypothetical protein
MYSIVECPDIVVAAAATESNPIRASVVYDDADVICIMAPTGAEASTIQVCDDPDAAVPVWVALQDSTPADVAGPAAGKARFYTIPAKAFRLKYGAGVAAERTYKVNKRMTFANQAF